MARLHAVATNIWHDERFLSCDDRSRMIFLALATSPVRHTVPGLVAIGPGALAEQLHRPTADVMDGLRRLSDAGLVQVDDTRRVIRATVIFDTARNPNVLTSWFRTWSDMIPNGSPLKRAHLPVLSLHVPLGGKLAATWQQTFQPHLEAYVQDIIAQTGAVPDDVSKMVERGAIRQVFMEQIMAPEVAQSVSDVMTNDVQTGPQMAHSEPRLAHPQPVAQLPAHRPASEETETETRNEKWGNSNSSRTVSKQFNPPIPFGNRARPRNEGLGISEAETVSELLAPQQLDLGLETVEVPVTPKQSASLAPSGNSSSGAVAPTPVPITSARRTAAKTKSAESGPLEVRGSLTPQEVPKLDSRARQSRAMANARSRAAWGLPDD